VSFVRFRAPLQPFTFLALEKSILDSLAENKENVINMAEN
jgi:hypothetical protein